MLPTAVTTLALLFAPALPAPDLDHAEMAASFRERRSVEGVANEDLELEIVLENHYTSAQLGAFEVHFPMDALEDEHGVDLFRDGVGGLIDVQEAWLATFATPAGVDDAKADFKVLRKWLKKVKRFRPASDGPADFLSAFGGNEDTLYAARHLAEVLASAKSMGFEPVGAKRARIVLSPTRRDFVESVCFFGQLLESIKGLYWHQAVMNWTEFWWQDVQVVALIYPSAPDSGDPYRGYDMNKRESTGVGEHVAQRGAIALGWYSFGDGLSPTFELGLAQMLVIDAYEQNNVRSGGAIRGNVTHATTAFIPGGNPGGGILPGISADSGWRADRGEDYFTEVLHASQKTGGKHADEAKSSSTKWKKQAWFQLNADGGSGRTYVSAPFLGTLVRGKATPSEEYMSDYLEFYRAYKTNFLYWLREHALGKGKRSAANEAFRDLMGRTAAAKGAGDFEEFVEAVYGMPLSLPDGEGDSLEWGYLGWLSKQ